MSSVKSYCCTATWPLQRPFRRGCRLHPRCPMALQVCAEVEPEWKEVAPRHWTACHLY